MPSKTITKKLRPRKPRKQLDLFIADLTDISIKDDQASMEHPLFTLSKKRNIKIRVYEHNNNKLRVIPSVLGAANVWDKDILIYCASQIMAAKNRGERICKRVRITAHDLMLVTHRDTGGKAYKQLDEALLRLRGTVLHTNIVTGGVRQREGFGLIESYKIIERTRDGRMGSIEIVLSEWFYNALTSKQVLTIVPDYFRLTSGVERRIYELAKKHTGDQAYWRISLDKLHKKTGSSDTLKKFRLRIRDIVKTQEGLQPDDVRPIPEFMVVYESEEDLVLFFSLTERGHRARLRHTMGRLK